jgi:hypothetical protein
MTSLLSRAIATIRFWVGLNDPAENRPYPSHGWLLSPPVAAAVAPARLPSPAPSKAPGRCP